LRVTLQPVLCAACFYWAVMVITGTGGTDFYREAFNSTEQLFITALVITGAVLWTYVTRCIPLHIVTHRYAPLHTVTSRRS